MHRLHPKTIRGALLALALAWGVFSPLAKAEYIPIAVGDEWTMAATFVAPSGKTTEGLIYRRIETADAKDGKAYVRSRTWTAGLAKRPDSTKLLRKDANAVYSIDESTSDSPEQIEAVLPLKIGSTWQQTAGSQTLTNTIVGREAVEISGKTYEDCYHIRISTVDGSYTEDFWEAPRVGNVKSIITYGSGAKLILTLKEFKSGIPFKSSE
jgi:hypothetical protein